MTPRFLTLLLCLFLGLALSSCYRILGSRGGGETNVTTRTLNPEDVVLPPGYRIEAVARELTFPAAVTFDNAGNLYAIEAGYSYGEVFLEPQLLRIGPDGSKTVVATGSKNGPWTNVTFHQGNFYVSEGGQMEGGRILRISPQGQITALIDSLPTVGDHHTNGVVVGPDGYLYFGLGVATNSGVVGEDNYDFGWLKRFPDFHDIPCADVTLRGANFKTDQVLTEQRGDKATTGVYVPFGTTTTSGQVIRGKIPCTGAVLRMPLSGGQPELVAWGFRNPFGLAFSPDGQLYVADNAYDDRGSRPVWGSGDYLWRVEPGTWYGWPDFSGGLPLHYNTFKVPGGPDPEFILAEHPNEPPRPVARLDVHGSSSGLDFSTSQGFGQVGQVFIAQFGDMAPDVGKVLSPVGYRVVKIDPQTGVVEEFAANRGKKNGPATWLENGGLERPVSVQFSPDGNALYIVDFGILRVTDEGSKPEQRTGVIWKITKS